MQRESPWWKHLGPVDFLFAGLTAALLAFGLFLFFKGSF